MVWVPVFFYTVTKKGDVISRMSDVGMVSSTVAGDEEGGYSRVNFRVSSVWEVSQ